MAKNQLGKITVSSIRGKPERAKTEEKEVYIGRFYGKAFETFEKIMDEGKPTQQKFTGIAGPAEAINGMTGEIYQSGILYLPAGIHDYLVEQVKNIPPDEPDTCIIYAFDLFSYPAKNLSGYSYISRKIEEVDQGETADLLSDVRGMLPPMPKQLTAPAKADPIEQLTGTATKV
jgi:hypothetical protein